MDTLPSVTKNIVFARNGSQSSPALRCAICPSRVSLFLVQIMREVVEPLREGWQRKLAVSQLARVIRQRALDIGVDPTEVLCFLQVQKECIRGLGTRQTQDFWGVSDGSKRFWGVLGG